MKKNILSALVILLLCIVSGFAQDPALIIEENFQDWPASEGVVSDPPADCESIPTQNGPFTYDISYLTGGSGRVNLIKYGISPECNTKMVNQGESGANAPGVTTGFVSLRKISEETDTVGQMHLPKLSHVSRIEFSYSCTSSDRGVRLYTSTDDGVSWEGPWTEDGPGTGEIIGSVTKLGEFVELDIMRDDVILKFTSGVDYDGVSQMTRIHDLLVWGVPGSQETGIEAYDASKVKAYYSSGVGLIIEGDVVSMNLYDIAGRKVLQISQAGSQTLDISHLPKGIYFVKGIDLSSKPFIHKFMKN